MKSLLSKMNTQMPFMALLMLAVACPLFADDHQVGRAKEAVMEKAGEKADAVKNKAHRVRAEKAKDMKKMGERAVDKKCACGGEKKCEACNAKKHMRGEKKQRMMEKLGLTDEQRAEHDSIKARFDGKIDDQKRAVEAAEDDLQNAIDSADDSRKARKAIKKKRNRVRLAKKELGDLHHDKKMAVRGLLTDEQKAKKREMRAKHKEMKKKMRGAKRGS